MRSQLMTLAVATGLVAAAPAAAGGFATAGLAPPPGDVRAGDTWVARVTILQHGRTPLTGVEPSVTITNTDSGERRSFRALPTDEPGVYEASVYVPTAGDWRYEVDDGFAGRHTFAPFEVAGAPGRGSRFTPVAVVAVAIVVVAIVGLTRQRRARAVGALR